MSMERSAARVDSSGGRLAGAVFLSYASQDTDAARRIRDALRAAGVEVWFDQNELVGGDAWDAKIRRQIKDCALFVPIISLATQARLEGYFRLEWKLAAQRTHTMAAAKAFLLPVVIDGTRDTEAHVPEEFLAVQWTRLPGEADAALAAFCARAKKLLSSPVERETVRPRSPEAMREVAMVPPPGPVKRGWAHYLWPAVGLIFGLIYAFRPTGEKGGRRSVQPPVAAAPTVAAPVSEARKLVAQARALFQDGDDGNRENFFLAEDLLKRAVSLDLTDSEVWAAYGQLSVELYRYGFDRTPARLEAMRTEAERAIKLDPNSIEAQLAAAGAGDYLGVEQNATEPKLRALAEQAAGNWRVLQALGRKLGRAGKVDESVAILARADELAGGNPAPWADAAAYLIAAGRYPEAETAVVKSLARRPGGRARVWDIVLKLGWQADVVAAAAALQQWPAWLFIEDRGASLAGLVWLWSRQPEKALAIYQRMPRDYLRDTFFTGPRAALTALAHEQSGHPEAALADWRVVAQLADRELAAAPGDGNAVYWKAWALARLGDRATAEGIRQQLAQRGWAPASFFAPEAKLAGLALMLGQADAACTFLQRELDRQKQAGVLFANSALHYPLPRAVLELNPIFDPVRSEERFRRLLEQAPAPAAMSAPVPEKSVAVLAFRNIGGNPADEAFVDGIGEELIHVLGRVPGLTVKGRSSLDFYQGKDVPLQEQGRRLGVTYLVDGSVRRSGDQARIVARLVRAATNEVVWSSDPLNRDTRNVFAVQEEIAALIAQALSLKFGAGSAASTVPVKPEAFELYVQARQAWNLRTLAGFDRAEQLLQRALELEPNFARAHAALADVWFVRGQDQREVGRFGARDSPLQRQVIARIRLALELDSNSAEANASLGGALWIGWELAASERALRRAIELNPNYASAHQWLGRCLLAQGRIDEALRELKTAALLDPLSSRIADNLGRGLCAAGRFTEAGAVYDQAIALQPRSFQALRQKAWVLKRLGQPAEAAAILRSFSDQDWPSQAIRVEALAVGGLWPEATAAFTGFDSRVTDIAIMLAYLGRAEEALAALNPDAAVSMMIDQWLFDAAVDPLRHDPRFTKFLATLGLTEAHARAQAWRAAQSQK